MVASLWPLTGRLTEKLARSLVNVGVTLTSPSGILKVALFVQTFQLVFTAWPPQVTLSPLSTQPDAGVAVRVTTSPSWAVVVLASMVPPSAVATLTL